MLFTLIGAALAYDTIGATWAEFPVSYEIADDLGGGMDDADIVEAIQAGFSTWEGVECADIEFSYDGRFDGQSFGGEADGHNVVYIIEEGWTASPSLLTTQAIWTQGGEIVEADMALNAQYFAWKASGADGMSFFDVQAGVTHEVGHVLGLWHSTETGATLNPAMDGNPEANTLEDDDIQGVCTIYAGGSEGALGDACTESDDCVDDAFCMVDGAERYCSTECGGAEDCPAGFDCLDVGDDQSACARAQDAGCGCTSVGRGARGWWLALLALLALVVRRVQFRVRQSR